MNKINEDIKNQYVDFNSFLKKRIKANRSHFLKNIDIKNWPSNKFVEYKGFLYIPLHVDWPENRDYGVLYVKLVGSVRKLQSGPSTTVVPINPQQIKIQISHEMKKK